eukprot:jgi/Astpho2/9277/Aster-x0847
MAGQRGQINADVMQLAAAADTAGSASAVHSFSSLLSQLIASSQVSLLGKDAAQLCRQLLNWLSQPGLDEQTQAAVLKAVSDMIGDNATKALASLCIKAANQGSLALAVCCSKSPDRPPLVTLQHIAQASMAVLEAALSGPAPIESRPASQLYAAALRALLAGLSEAKGQPGVGLLSLLGCLQKLLTFCARPAATSSAPLQRSPVNSGGLVAGSWVARQVPSRSCSPQQKARYQPPHLRRQSSSSSGWSDSSDTESQASNSDAGSDSDGSIWSRVGAAGTRDRLGSSRVRLAVLSCIQVLVKADCKLLHQHYAGLLLPVHSALAGRRSAATLMDAVVSDPSAKVRAAAATTVAMLLEGAPQRSYLGIAELTSSRLHQPVRGFTTLSTTLGRMILSLHDGLLQALASEQHAAAASALLQALQALLRGAPYHRLPEDLLPRTLEALRRRLPTLEQLPCQSLSDKQRLVAAACACLGAGLSTKARHAGVAALLQQQAHDPSGVLAALLANATGRSGAQVEALSALVGVAQNYDGALQPHWHQLSAFALQQLQANQQVVASPRSGTSQHQDKAPQLTLQLLGALLQAGVQHQVPGGAAAQDVVPHTAQPGQQQPAMMSYWEEVCKQHVPQGLSHASASVRAAACSIVVAMPAAAFHCLDKQMQQQLQACMLVAAGRDAAAAPRAAAVRAAAVQWHACEAAARILSASSASSALPCDLDGLATALAEILEACENYKVAQT